MPTTYILINSDLGSDMEIIQKIKEILDKESSVKYEVQGVYGVYDIIIKITADSMELLRNIITNKIRKIDKVYSTLTMMVIEEQEK
ncbi:MAG: Lrp/AsnC ligand binding domain-containing protein [Nitrosotalea sp.]